jgi:hypothetical protein
MTSNTVTLAHSRYEPDNCKRDNYIKPALLQASATRWTKTALYCDITLRIVAFHFRRFRTTSHILKGQEILS